MAPSFSGVIMQTEVGARPLYDFVFIRKDPEQKMAGRFVLPAKAKQKSTRGRVVAVGPGIVLKGRRVKPICEVGDVVHWNEHKGMDFKLGDETLMALHDDEIECIEDQ